MSGGKGTAVSSFDLSSNQNVTVYRIKDYHIRLVYIETQTVYSVIIRDGGERSTTSYIA